MNLVWLWISLGAVGFLALATLATAFICYRLMLYSKPRHLPGEGEYEIPEGEIYEAFREDMIAWTNMIRAYPYREYAIKSHDGLTLRAKFYEYEAGAPIELMFHGYRGYAERDLSGGVERCFRLGHSALLIDHRGAGLSDGSLITFGILERRDCLAWVDFAVKEFGADAKLILTGISMGAATVMMATGGPLQDNVKAAVADCGFTNLEHLLRYSFNRMGHKAISLPAPMPFKALFGLLRKTVLRRAGYDLKDVVPQEAVARSKTPTLFIHGGCDEVVPPEMMGKLYEAARCPKRYLIVPAATHADSAGVDPKRYWEAVESFLNRYMN